MKTMRSAIIAAVTVEVQCPHCGTCQPNPEDETDFWTPPIVFESQGPRTCVSCDEKFHLFMQSKVSIN